MNCISGSKTRPLLLGITIMLVGTAPPSVAVSQEADLQYGVVYTVRPDPFERVVHVTLAVQQSRALMRVVSMRNDGRVSAIGGDGDVDTTGDRFNWRTPPQGGELHWQVRPEHRRNGDGYDAWLGPDWGIFRAEDIIPRATTRTLKGARSNTRMRFDLPQGWSVISQYFGRNHSFNVANPKRRFDQPTGWIIVGTIGVRRETVAGTRVAVAGPVGNTVRRMDTLALLLWTLPELARIVPELPPRLTIVSAGDPMWRGGLSAPQSLYVHSDRPLISENATSTLLHETMHLALGISAEPGYDWIVEGLAEFYSLELLARSGSISRSRYRSARRKQVDWSANAPALCQQQSTGPVTALAVTVFGSLDREIREASDGQASIDDLASRLWRSNAPLNIDRLTRQAAELIGHKPDALHIDKLPGCRNIDAAVQAPGGT